MSRPVVEIGGGDGDGERDDLALMLSRSPTILVSETDSARYEDTEDGQQVDGDGGRRSCSEVPDLVSEEDNELPAEIPFESSQL